jgi:hypothetical protein
MEELVKQNPSVADFRDAAADYGPDVVNALLALGHAGEAKIVSDRSVPRIEGLVHSDPRNIGYRGNLAANLLRRGQVLRAEGDLAGAAALWRRAAGLYGDLPDLSTAQRVVAACCHAALASVAGLPGAAVPATERPLEAGRAMELLRQAVARGFRQCDWLRTEAALDSLRSRTDFQMLLLDLAMPDGPFSDRR